MTNNERNLNDEARNGRNEHVLIEDSRLGFRASFVMRHFYVP